MLFSCQIRNHIFRPTLSPTDPNYKPSNTTNLISIIPPNIIQSQILPYINANLDSFASVPKLTNKEINRKLFENENKIENTKIFQPKNSELKFSNYVKLSNDFEPTLDEKVLDSINVSDGSIDPVLVVAMSNQIFTLDKTKMLLDVWDKNSGAHRVKINLQDAFPDATICGSELSDVVSVDMKVDKMTRPSRLAIAFVAQKSNSQSVCTVISANDQVTYAHSAEFQTPFTSTKLQLALMPTVYQMILSNDKTSAILAVQRVSIVRGRLQQTDVIFTPISTEVVGSSIDGIIKVGQTCSTNASRAVLGEQQLWAKGADWGNTGSQRFEFSFSIENGHLSYLTSQYNFPNHQQILRGMYTLPVQVNGRITSLSARFVARDLPQLSDVEERDDLYVHDLSGNTVEEMEIRISIVEKSSVKVITCRTVDAELLKIVDIQTYDESIDDAKLFVDKMGQTLLLIAQNGQIKMKTDGKEQIIGQTGESVNAEMDASECSVWCLVKNNEGRLLAKRLHSELCSETKHILFPVSKELKNIMFAQA